MGILRDMAPELWRSRPPVSESDQYADAIDHDLVNRGWKWTTRFTEYESATRFRKLTWPVRMPGQ